MCQIGDKFYEEKNKVGWRGYKEYWAGDITPLQKGTKKGHLD